jgi:hypothetical protein
VSYPAIFTAGTVIRAKSIEYKPVVKRKKCPESAGQCPLSGSVRRDKTLACQFDLILKLKLPVS